MIAAVRGGCGVVAAVGGVVGLIVKSTPHGRSAGTTRHIGGNRILQLRSLQLCL